MPAKATQKAGYAACSAAGDFYLTPLEPGSPYRRLSFLCPCGCGILAGVRVRADGVQDGSAWGWNKSEQCPTTQPSILINGNHWHGYLTDGNFVEC